MRVIVERRRLGKNDAMGPGAGKQPQLASYLSISTSSETGADNAIGLHGLYYA